MGLTVQNRTLSGTCALLFGKNPEFLCKSALIYFSNGPNVFIKPPGYKTGLKMSFD
jgi:hypothetical protein